GAPPKKKTVFAGPAAGLVAGSAVSYSAFAQQQTSPRSETRWQPSAADRAAFADARIAALHAGLKLTPDQEKLWPPIENVLKDLAQKRTDRFEKMRAERE